MTEFRWLIHAGCSIMLKYEVEDIVDDEIDVTQQNCVKSGRYVKIGKQQVR